MLEAVWSQSSLVPAAVHVDGSVRLQTVRREQNELLYDLLNSLSPAALLNTSLNIKGQPIINDVADLLLLMKTSSLQHAFADDYYISKVIPHS